jgi:hypothetical protein
MRMDDVEVRHVLPDRVDRHRPERAKVLEWRVILPERAVCGVDQAGARVRTLWGKQRHVMTAARELSAERGNHALRAAVRSR